MRFDGILGAAVGSAELYADGENKDRFVSLVTQMGICAKVREENGGVLVSVRPSDAKKIASALDKSGIIVYINSVCGIKSILARAINRLGLLLGGILFFALLMLSTLFVFKVEVSGSELLSKEQVRAELAELGVRAGARIDELDADAVRDAFLMAHPEFSWAAVNVKGTTVCLELKERSTASSETEEKHSLLVAETDGVVKYLTVVSGKALVSSGSSVKKGDLLISGYVSGSGLQYTDDPLLRYDGAAGKVYAQITGRVSITVPLEESTEAVSAGERLGVRLSVFGKSFTLGRYGNGDGSVIESERNLTVLGVIELPITVSECKKLEKSTALTVRSEADALAEAKKRAFLALDEELGEATLTETEVTTEITERGAAVTVVYGCLKNIAVPKDIGK